MLIVDFVKTNLFNIDFIRSFVLIVLKIQRFLPGLPIKTLLLMFRPLAWRVRCCVRTAAQWKPCRKQMDETNIRSSTSRATTRNIRKNRMLKSARTHRSQMMVMTKWMVLVLALVLFPAPLPILLHLLNVNCFIEWLISNVFINKNYISVNQIKELEDEILAMQGERRSFIAERNDLQCKWSRFQEGAEQDMKAMREESQKYITANEKLREACERKNKEIGQLQAHLTSQFAIFKEQSARKGKLLFKTISTFILKYFLVVK